MTERQAFVAKLALREQISRELAEEYADYALARKGKWYMSVASWRLWREHCARQRKSFNAFLDNLDDPR